MSCPTCNAIKREADRAPFWDGYTFALTSGAPSVHPDVARVLMTICRACSIESLAAADRRFRLMNGEKLEASS